MGETIQVKKIVLIDGQFHEAGTAVLYDNYIMYNVGSEGKMDFIIPWGRVSIIELWTMWGQML